MKQKIIPIVSIVVGLIAFILTVLYLRGKQEEFNKMKADFFKNAKQLQIVVAAVDIPAGTVLSKGDLGVKTVYEMGVSFRGLQVSVEDAELLLGKKTLFRIPANNPILWSDIEGGMAKEGLANIVKPGLRAISLPVSGAAAVSSLIQPNDRVDLIGSFNLPSKSSRDEMEAVTLTILQDVSVLATGQEIANTRPSSRRQNRSSSYSTVTLEVTPREAELLVFVQQMKGKLTLSLRNPGDISFEKDLPEVNFSKMESQLPELNQYRQRNIRHKRD